ncbi:MAG: S-layer homology domain-containing protein [Clostridiaceae bacterium]|nr:S-layer homology domain-containing protein [Clostridiaceae bacterium]
MYRKIVSLMLIMTIILSLASTVYAATTAQPSQDQAASTLKDLGLFMGTNNGFELDRAPTRTEAIVLLLRMLGKEQEAKDSNYTHSFTDVPAWANKHIAYAYNKGLTNGYSSTVFGGSDDATPEQFCALTLRALEYNEKDGDFVYKESIKKAEELGLAAAGKYKVGAKNFTRGDCVDIIYKALAVVKKTEGVTLAESLVKANVIDAAKAESYGLYSAYEKIRVPLRKDPKTGEMTLYLADVIKQVPGAKYGSLFYGGGITSLTDYEKAFDQELYRIYEELTNPSKSADLLNRLTNASTIPSDFTGPGGTKTFLFCAVYDGNTNVLAESISKWQEVADNKYIELALVNISLKSLVDARDTEFSKLFGNPVEAPNAITTIEKANLHIITINHKTGETIEDCIETNYSYRLVIDSNKYPDLAKKTVNFDDFTVPHGMTALEAVKKYLKNKISAPYFNGKFVGPNSSEAFALYNNQWTQHASDWNNPRCVVFDDGEKPIAYTTIYPSQLKVVDVGQVKVEIYKDIETDTVVKSVYTIE